MKRALVFGSTGFVGNYLLGLLLESPEYAEVTIVVRKDPGRVHPKLKVVIADFDTLPSRKGEIMADEVFITLGTTKKRTPDREDYYRADHDYPVLAARVAKERGAKSVFLLTAVGSDAASGIFYIRTKGETERDVIAAGLEHTHIFRPSMILGDREEFRLLEKIAIAIWPFVSWMLQGRSLKKYRGIEAREIAAAMVNAARTQTRRVAFYHWEEMKNLLSQ